MPNRVLRDWTDSEVVDKLSAKAEVFFTRLIMKADDFGCYHANEKLLKSNLYPLRTAMRETELAPLLLECTQAGLITLYEHERKKYLIINNFGQRLRLTKRKFPAPEKHDSELLTNDSEFPPETETETETEARGEMPQAAARTKLELLEIRKSNFYEDLKPFLSKYNKEMLRKFYEYWSEFNKSKTKMRWELQETFEISKRLSTWASRDKDFDKKGIETIKKSKSTDL